MEAKPLVVHWRIHATMEQQHSILGGREWIFFIHGSFDEKIFSKFAVHIFKKIVTFETNVTFEKIPIGLYTYCYKGFSAVLKAYL